MITAGGARRQFAPGVGTLLVYVLLVGNPWVSRTASTVGGEHDNVGGMLASYFFFPRWYIDLEGVGVWGFWMADIRTIVFVLLVVFGLNRAVQPVMASKMATFAATTGVTVLGAVIASVSGIVLASLVTDMPSLISGPVQPTEHYFVLNLLFDAAIFGVLFGAILGVAAVAASGSRVAPTFPTRACLPNIGRWFADDR
ncbi:hypothetical protein [Haloechinothrix salitolerans]|uniref:Uncharacterized protein n=1 Tax=Haloechinothrix salitolerans TaxID=926830 RepID=A0ABW2BZB2_9PSEU